MAEYDFDLITIGAGSGGVAASRRAGMLGARVALCELDRIGGTCVLRGCVPKKLLVYGATFAQDFVDAAGFGWELGSTRCDWAMLQAAKERELDRLNGAYKRMLADAKVTTFSGRAELVDAHTVAIGEQRITAERILLATGGWPLRPEVPGSELGITSNEALSLPAVPRRLIVVGGGYIGVEFAGIYAALGTQVTMVVRGPLPLRGFDEEAREHLAALLVKRGIALRPHSQLAAIERSDDGSLVVRLQSGDVLLGDQVLLATGRGPNTRGLGLERVGVECRPSGAIAVNEFSQSSVASIYAIGDCTDRINLTPVAIAEGRAFVETVYRNNPTPVRHELVPTAVFSMPPLAAVGLSESEARARHGEDAIDIYATMFRPMKNTLAGREERTFMKLVVDRSSQRVLGCHMVGADAPEIIQGLAVALTAGATKADFDRTLALHPTAAEEFVLMREPRRPPAAV